VLKNATWYLVARRAGDLRTYRVGEIATLETLESTFDAPADFDLRAYWESSTERFEKSLARGTVTLRVTPRALPFLGRLGPGPARPSGDGADPNVVIVPIESMERAAREVLALGDSVEVLAPPALRERVAAAVRAMANVYGAS
jgi:predicted DNA-binding transcriptional regulator YafY